MVHKATCLLLLAGATTLFCLSPDRERGSRDALVDVDALRRHVTYLASDELGGRGPGTEGDRKSAAYLVERLSSSGLRPLFTDRDGTLSFFQPFVLRSRRTIETPTFRLRFADRVEHLETGKDIAVRWTDAPYRRELRLMYVGYGIREPEVGWDDLAGVDVDGRCAVVEIGAPPEAKSWPRKVRDRYRDADAANLIKANHILEAGASCLLGISPRDSSMPWDQIVRDSRTSFLDIRGMGGQVFPNMLLLMMSRDWAEKLFEHEPFDPSTNRGHYHSFELSTSLDSTLSLEERGITTRNVAALVPGTDPSLEHELVTLSAHFDGLGTVDGTIYNGANDNAASVAALLEAARLQALRPARRPVAFLFFSAEEIGLLGSYYFLESSPVPIDDFAVNVNFEMVGGDLGRGFDVNGTTSLSSDLRPILDAANGNGPRAQLDFSLDRKNGGGWVSGRSDHYNFYRKNIAVLYLVGGGSRHYHSAGDDAGTVDFDRTLDAAWLAFELAQELGNRDARPRIDM